MKLDTESKRKQNKIKFKKIGKITQGMKQKTSKREREAEENKSQ